MILSYNISPRWKFSKNNGEWGSKVGKKWTGAIGDLDENVKKIYTAKNINPLFVSLLLSLSPFNPISF